MYENIQILKSLKGNSRKESYILKHYPYIYMDIISFNINFIDKEFNQQLFNYIHIISNPIKCKNENCKNDVNFYTNHYSKFCSISCSSTDIEKNRKMVESTKKTLSEKYGVDNIFELDFIQDKIKNTMKEKYGVEHISQNKILIQKSIDNMYKRDYEKSSKKRKKTILEKYGYDNIAKDDFIKEKIKNTCIEKYNVPYPLLNKNVDKKRQETFLKNWNGHPLSNKEQILKRSKNRKITMDELWLNIIEKKYNLTVISYTNDEKYDFTTKRKLFSFCDKCCKEFEIYDYLIYSRHNNNEIICTICNPISKFTSNKENQLKEYINSLDIDHIENDHSILDRKELDIYIPSKNLALEFNGLYWHSELYKDSNYHKEKTELCEQKGINLLHIFEDDWIYKQDIIKSIIKNRLGIVDINNKIYARKCIIKEVDSKTTRSFLDNNHIQGFSNSSYKLGLYYNDELVSIMTFGYRHTNSKKEFELIRFCNKIDYTIVGAASKLFKHFIKNYSKQLEENYLISYADISLFDGSLYNTLGFSFKHRTKPNYFWVVGGKREHRFKYNKQKLIKEGENPLMTEREIMYEKGYYRIFGSGQDRYEYYF